MAKKAPPKSTKSKPRKPIAINKNVVIGFGFALIAIALFLFTAIISYFFHWQKDYAAIDLGFWELLKSESTQVRNFAGKIGGAAAHRLVFLGYGIAAFIYPYYLMQWGIRLALEGPKRPMWRNTGRALFLLLWTPTFLAYILPHSLELIFGARGLFAELWLNQLTGPIGTGLILITAFALFSLMVWKITPAKIRQWLIDKKNERASIEKTVHAQPKEETAPKVEKTPEPREEVPEEHVLEMDLDNNEPEEESTNNDSSSLELETTPIPEEESNEEVAANDDLLEVEDVKQEEELDDKAINKRLKEFSEYDPTLDLSRFQLPPIDLLKQYTTGNITIDSEELEKNKTKIVNTLADYKIEISKIKATIGPTVTLYEIVPAAGVRISKIKNLEDDIALNLAALGIRIIAPIPGRGTIGIEVPNQNPQMVAMKNLLSSEKFQNSDYELPIALGKTISNETYIADLAKMPHLLMAGATGQGKSVGLNVILTSLLYKKHPSQVKFILVDPKKVELTLFNKIERHYLAKLPNSEDAIITDTKKVVYTLNSLCIEMDDRYELLKNAMVRNIKEYNQKFIQRRLNPEEGHRYLPYIVLVIDEFADLIMTAGKEVETPIARLAQLARAIGIHLIVATQRPSVNVITGIIKANFPARIAFRVTAKVDSRTILDAGGAEQLIGKGDMLLASGSDLIRIQCAFVDTPEIEDITSFIGAQQGYPEAYILPEYEGEESSESSDVDLSDRDSMFEDAARIIVTHQQGSASLLQRKLRLGYNRAGRIVDQLEAAGIIGPFEGSKARQVLIKDEASLEQLLKNM